MVSLVTKFNFESSVVTQQPFQVFFLEFEVTTYHSQHIQDAAFRGPKGQMDITRFNSLTLLNTIGLDFLFCLTKK